MPAFWLRAIILELSAGPVGSFGMQGFWIRAPNLQLSAGLVASVLERSAGLSK